MQLHWKYCIFGKNSKPIALLFYENWPFLVASRFTEEMQLRWKYCIFGENAKPYFLMKIDNFWLLGDLIGR